MFLVNQVVDHYLPGHTPGVLHSPEILPTCYFKSFPPHHYRRLEFTPVHSTMPPSAPTEQVTKSASADTPDMSLHCEEPEKVTDGLKESLTASKSMFALRQSLPESLPTPSQECGFLEQLSASSCQARDSICQSSSHHAPPCQCNKRYLDSHSSSREEESNSHHSIIDSLNSLCVSCSDPVVNPVLMRRSCREEASAAAVACAAGSLDDTTVDDLAGYLDEIMYLPQPMSEMAELMYT